MTLSDLAYFTRADQVGSIVVRGVVWLIGVLIVAMAVDRNKEERKIRMDVGWFFAFLFTAGILSYFLFGFVPTF